MQAPDSLEYHRNFLLYICIFVVFLFANDSIGWQRIVLHSSPIVALQA